MKVQNSSLSIDDLLGRPMIDLLEEAPESFAGLLREQELPADRALEVLDAVLRHRLVQVLGRSNDRDAWAAELDGMRRLVPHARHNELDARAHPWATRWSTLADVVAAAGAAHVARENRQTDASHSIRQRAQTQKVITTLLRSPQCSQADLARETGIKQSNLSRILGLLEADGLIKREAVGREKLVSLTQHGWRRQPRNNFQRLSEFASSRHEEACEMAATA